MFDDEPAAGIFQAETGRIKLVPMQLL